LLETGLAASRVQTAELVSARLEPAAGLSQFYFGMQNAANACHGPRVRKLSHVMIEPQTFSHCLTP